MGKTSGVLDHVAELKNDLGTKLSSDFGEVTREEWLGLVEKALKGGDFEKRLVSRTADGLRIEPLYHPDRGAGPNVGQNISQNAGLITRKGAGNPWRVCARVDHPNPKQANAQVLQDLEGGVDALALVFQGSRSARGFGLSCNCLDDLDAALADVNLEMISLRVDPGPGGRTHAGLVAALVARRGMKAGDCTIDFGLDPIGKLAIAGRFDGDTDAIGRRIGDAATHLSGAGFKGPFVSCDTRAYHEAGASEVLELACALATGVLYLRALSDSGMQIEDASRALSFTLAIDADQFMGIAKLRALRKAWARVEEASGIAPKPITIHAEMAWRMMSRRDPWVNMLRATMTTFVAGIGGADSMTVLPFTQPLGLPDAFARRVARNAQTVLLEESNLWRVADPAAGSGAYEALTNELADAAWAAFQEIESEGGMVESLKAGKIQSRIDAVRAQRAKDVATRKVALTGTSEFPLLSEVAVEVEGLKADNTAPALRMKGASPDTGFPDLLRLISDGATREAAPTTHASGGLKAQPLPSVRLGEPFEALRDASDAQLAKSGARPSVFMASLGKIAEHTAPSTWVRNLLAAGGIAAAQQDGFASADEAAAAFKASGAVAACISSSDALYAEHAAATAKALKAAGAKIVLLAGRPGELEADLKAAGVDDFVFAGQDVLALLSQLQAKLAA